MQCSNCGAEMRQTAKICIRCGTAVGAAGTAEISTTQQHQKDVSPGQTAPTLQQGVSASSSPPATSAVAEPPITPSNPTPEFEASPEFANKTIPQAAASIQGELSSTSKPRDSKIQPGFLGSVSIWKLVVPASAILAITAYGITRSTSKHEEDRASPLQGIASEAPSSASPQVGGRPEAPLREAVEEKPSQSEPPTLAKPAATTSPNSQSAAAVSTPSPQLAAAAPTPVPSPVQSATVAASPPAVEPSPEQRAPTVTRSFSPSFDCAKATVAVEKAICGNEQLSALDRQLSEVFRTASAAALLASGPELERLRSTQRNWLRTRDQCRSISCVTSAYQTQIDSYKKQTDQFLAAAHAASTLRPADQSVQSPPVSSNAQLPATQTTPNPTVDAPDERAPEPGSGKFKVKFRDRFDNILAKRVYPTKDMADKAKALWDKDQLVLELDGSTRKPEKKGPECAIMGGC